MQKKTFNYFLLSTLLEKLLDLFESYQQMWTSLTTTFNGTIFAAQHGNLVCFCFPQLQYFIYLIFYLF